MAEPTRIPIDPVGAFHALQELHASEMGRLGGDLAVKNSYINQLEMQIKELQERLTGLEQNQESPLKVVENSET